MQDGSLRASWPSRRLVGRAALAGGALLALGAVPAWVALGGRHGPVGDPDGTGPVTLATGKDTTGYLEGVLQDWNAANPHQPVTLVQLPEAADEVYAQMVDELQQGGGRFDVLNQDVVWTAEFAARGWIAALPESDFDLTAFLPPVLGAARYGGHLYAVPYVTNAAMLYYRSDVLAAAGQRPPATWAELERQAATLAPARGMAGYAGQLWPYEGLTVNALEAIRSAGGDILDARGRIVVDSAGTRTGLEFLAGGLRAGWIPQAALGYQEEESREAFQSGKLLFLRNWPYVYPEAEAPGSPVAGRFGVVPLPGPHGPGAHVLGGSCLAVARGSARQRTARELIRYLTSAPVQARVLTQGGLPPVVADLYQDPELVARFPFLPVLRRAVLAAGSRPEIPQYQQLSLVFSEAVYEVLRGHRTPAAGLARLAADLREVMA
ncbi:ABC transporter substrate-binding protein [Streptacidiphilus sp. PB12-B1b]|uniref:ABC transporter substrate-binding protein n=1 Tax=Streptacidiphilus sp. PB12-B1b TaxID=2705012 RepID=UPI0015F9069F|nr:ABC transporter substrate-binding protein [Streptacidiphilus sp. PB12-B1b]QMU77901.1 ABC transporter substrate-binding protein [Streptacidiphilus sp. PB12-B1b]